MDGGSAEGRGREGAVSGSGLGGGRHQHTDAQTLLYRRGPEGNLQPAGARGLHGRTRRAAAHSLPSGLDTHTHTHVYVTSGDIKLIYIFILTLTVDSGLQISFFPIRQAIPEQLVLTLKCVPKGSIIQNHMHHCEIHPV